MAPKENQHLVQSEEVPRTGGSLAYGLNAETNGWNPGTNQWGAPGLQVSRAVFDTLTTYDERSQIKPFLAESFDHNTDLTMWTFKLRAGVKLHNGKPVTADTVVRNQTFLMRSPVTAGAYRYAGVTSFMKLDDLTFSVTLEHPSALLPTLFATQLGVVADPDWLESNDGLHPIGTGPFVFSNWKIGDSLKVTKNPDYWRVDAHNIRLPYLDDIEFKVIPDSSSRGNALQAGDVNMIESTSGEQILDFQGDSSYQVYSNPTGESSESFVMLNTMAEPFTDPDVRRALVLATDKEAFSDATSHRFEDPVNGMEEPSSPWYTATDYPQFDLDKARAMVAQAKGRHGGKLEFTLLSYPDPAAQVAAEVLQQQWAEAGFDVKIDLQELAPVIIRVVQGTYQAVRWGQFGAPNPYADGVWIDPSGAVAPPTFSLNFARNKDDEIGRALAAGIAASDVAVQKQQFAVIQQRLAADLPYVWLTSGRVSIVADQRVVNLTRMVLPDGTAALDLQEGAHQLAQIWLKT